MDVQDVIKDPPKFHRHVDGRPASWRMPPEVYLYISEHVDNNSKTLETGAGISTVIFALRQTNHICITKEREETDRIRDYCEKVGISVQKITFIIAKSENALPVLSASELDLVLIDGRHAFPTPFIDWYYTVDKLRFGGVLVIDDTHLWTGKTLMDFLLLEREWSMIREFDRSVVFKKLNDGSNSKTWGQQPYITKHSYYHPYSLPGRIRFHLGRIRGRIMLAVRRND